ncbi:MAG: MarR family transcriptional regulator [Kurthia sp.]|nr:MarR family transcriptional regulator [Candidatus Kurthia equi]
MKESEKKRLNLLIWFRLARVYTNSIKESNQHLKKWGLSAAQFDILVQIGTAKQMTQVELAQKLFVTKGNITQLLSKMENLGLVEREQEWRTKYVKLTARGESLFNEVTPLQEQFQADQFSSLNNDEKKQLLHLLRKIQTKPLE